MAKNSEMEHMGECCHGHKMWMGLKMLVLGLLVMANTYWMVLNWAMFVGVVLVVAGFLNLVIPHHHHHH